MKTGTLIFFACQYFDAPATCPGPVKNLTIGRR